MTWITENPTPAVVLGILVEAILVVVLMKTGRREALFGLIGVALATIGVVAASFLIVTPREEVTAALEEIRALVEKNDRPELVKRIHPTAIALRNQAQYQLQSLTIERASIDDVEIKIDPFGAVELSLLPTPVGAKKIGFNRDAMLYVAAGPPNETRDACRELLVDDGWHFHRIEGDAQLFEKDQMRLAVEVFAEGSDSKIRFSVDRARTARARFNGVVVIREGMSRPIPLRFEVDLEKVDGRWLVTFAQWAQRNPMDGGGNGEGAPVARVVSDAAG